MKLSAIACDAEHCWELAIEGRAAEMGWLTIGGNRRGRVRLDLCPRHALEAIKQITNTTIQRKKRVKP